MSLLVSAEVSGQFIVGKLYTNFDNQIDLARTVTRPVFVNETLLDAIDLEFIALRLAVDSFGEFLFLNDWSIRVPPFSAQLLFNYFRSGNRIQAAWSVSSE